MQETSDDTRPKLGELIRAVREQRGMSARSLSLACGLSESAIGKVEAGSDPALQTFSKMVRVLQLSPWEVWVLAIYASA